MRTRLFRSFLFIILTALLSNFIFQWLIVKDFERYVDKRERSLPMDCGRCGERMRKWEVGSACLI
jgi:hypothetical protein